MLQAALPSGAPSALSPPLEPPSSLAEALEQVVAAGLPLLEHNGFQGLFADEAPPFGAGSGSSSRDGSRRMAPSADAGAAHGADAAVGALAAAISRHATADTHLGLGAFVKDSATGAYRVLPSNPLAPPAVGRGLLLVSAGRGRWRDSWGGVRPATHASGWAARAVVWCSMSLFPALAPSLPPLPPATRWETWIWRSASAGAPWAAQRRAGSRSGWTTAASFCESTASRQRTVVYRL